MRTIKFRGIRKDNGDWVEGYYWKTNVHWIIRDGAHYEVLPETVGQWTPGRDVNHDELWDGDILFHDGQNVLLFFNDCTGSFDYMLPSGEVVMMAELMERPNDFERVGNIHEQPYLFDMQQAIKDGRGE